MNSEREKRAVGDLADFIIHRASATASSVSRQVTKTVRGAEPMLPTRRRRL